MQFLANKATKNREIPLKTARKILARIDVQGVSGSSPLASTIESPEPQGVQDFFFFSLSGAVSYLLVTSMLWIAATNSSTLEWIYVSAVV